MTASLDNDPVPVAAAAKLTELRDLAALALECWHSGDRQAALDAVSALMPVAGAAGAAKTREQGRQGENPSHWLG